MIRSRNWRVRGSCGAEKIWAGSPCSRITPASRKQIAARDVAREPHLVGRDQHRHPAGGELADHVQHLRDELGIECARHLVEQHHVRLHRERAHDRDALLLPPGEPVGIVVALVREPEAAEELVGLGLGPASREPARLLRPERHVPEHAHVREEVVGLEDDPDPAPDRVHVDPGRGDLVAADDDPAGVDRLEQVHAAEERRLAGAGGADQADDLVLGHVEVDPLQHLELPERLADAVDLDHTRLPACRRRLSRATSQSVKRASGIVIATKSVAATR